MPAGVPMVATSVSSESLASLVKEEPGSLLHTSHLPPYHHYQPGLKHHQRTDDHAYRYQPLNEPLLKKMRPGDGYVPRLSMEDYHHHQGSLGHHHSISPENSLPSSAGPDFGHAPLHVSRIQGQHGLPALPNSLDTRRHRLFDPAHAHDLHPHSQHPLQQQHHQQPQQQQHHLHSRPSTQSPVGSLRDQQSYLPAAASSSLYTNSLDALSFAAVQASSDHPGQQRLLSEGPGDHRVELMNAGFGLNHGYQMDPSRMTRMDTRTESPADNRLDDHPENRLESGHVSEEETDSRQYRARKRRCSICNRYFAKLTTHKNTHLAEENRPCICSICGRGFSRANDLQRHERSHSEDGVYNCPLHFEDMSALGPLPDVETGPKCHKTGRFTRCDTYKNHVKAKHFQYPKGTTKRDRGHMHGNCRGCGQEFIEADTWFRNHIGTGECEGIRRIIAAKSKKAKSHR